MAVVTWTGEPGSSEQRKEHKGYKFKKDEGVSINDEEILKELEGDKNYRIEGGGPGPGMGAGIPGALKPNVMRRLEERDGKPAETENP